MTWCEDCGLWHDPLADCVLRRPCPTTNGVTMRYAILAAFLLAAALPASAQTPGTVLVLQTVADGNGGTYTRIAERPAGYTPVTAPPQMRGAIGPSVGFGAARQWPTLDSPRIESYPPPTFVPNACVNGRCPVR